MSLRQKALLLTTLTLAGLMLILAVVSSAIWFDSAAQLEQRDHQQNMSRITSALAGELADLDRLVGDWAGWDDTYAFVVDHNPDYIDSNLINATLLKDKLNEILFVDVTGLVVYSKTFDLAQQREIPASTQWGEYLPGLTNHLTTDSTIRSVVELDDRPILVAARPILTSDYQGPIRGTLIMGRDFTESLLHQLEQVTGLELAVHSPGDPHLPADFQQAYRALQITSGASHDAIYSLPLNEDTTAVYIMLPDLNDKPALLLRAEVPRSAYQNAQAATRTLAISLLLLGVVFGGLTVILIDRFVLRRLAQLEAGVRHLTDSGDLSARVPVAAHDELSSLVCSINRMLAAREQAQQENVRLYDAARRQLGELLLLHTAAIATARSASLDAALQEIAQSVYDAFEAVNTLVILCEPDRANLKIRASVGIPAEVLAARQFKAGQGIIDAVAQTGQAILANDVAGDPRYYEADARTRSELCAPLKIGERVIGMINVESDRLNAFTTDDLQLLQTLAHNLSTLVENLRLLEELRAANERLTELDRLKNQFVANMSHELRTPLNAILGFSELLLDGVPGPLNDEQRDYTQHINTSGQHLLTLINDILDLSKLQANRIDLERRTTYFADIAAAAQTFVWPGAQRRHQTLIIDVPPDLPGLYVDPLRVKQVLINLLNNASKFTPPEGRIIVRAEVWHEGWLRVSVSDTGPGIPLDKQAAIFEEFAQFDWERPVVERGTGLGLAIARRLVELHGGRIWIESAGQPGLGSAFYFTLPLADTAAVSRQTGTRLLIVDDDPLIIELLQSFLPPPDYDVSGLTDPAHISDRVLRDKPDVIVLDLQLPNINAFEILSALRQAPHARDIPVIALTAEPLSADERAAIEQLAQAVLPRTRVRREALINIIQQVRQTTAPA